MKRLSRDISAEADDLCGAKDVLSAFNQNRNVCSVICGAEIVRCLSEYTVF